MRWNFFKIFSRTSKPKLIKLGTGTYYPWVKGIQKARSSSKGR
jgi:hypothetical protein